MTGPILLGDELAPNRNPDRCPAIACEASCSTDCACSPCSCPRCLKRDAIARQAAADVAEHVDAEAARRYRYTGPGLDARSEIVEGPTRLPLHRRRDEFDEPRTPRLFD